MKYIKNIIIILLTFLTLSSYAFAQETLKIVTIERAPFVIQKGEKLTGFSIDLWKEIADYLEMPYEFEVQTNFAKMLNLIKKSEANAAISNITINTDRQEIFDFSDSYFEGGLQIMISRESEFNTILKSLQSKESKIILSIFLLLVLILSHLLWFAEKNENNGIACVYFPGIFECMWRIITLGEFGNSMPKKALTRIVFILWFMSLLFTFTLFGAGISSDLTLNRSINVINSYHDLHNKNIGVISGSTAESFMRKEKINYISYSNIEKMFSDVETSTLDAVIHDYPIVNHYVLNDGAGKVTLAGKIFKKEKYGIVFPKGSVLRDEVNTALLFLEENGTYNKLLNKWFGK